MTIGGITPRGKYMYVDGGLASTYINHSSGSLGTGNVRYNTINQRLEVYDGNSWHCINNSVAQIGLNDEAEQLLDWAKQKRLEELEYKSLALNNPAVAAALENLNKAKEQLYIIAQLSKEHETTTS